MNEFDEDDRDWMLSECNPHPKAEGKDMSKRDMWAPFYDMLDKHFHLQEAPMNDPRDKIIADLREALEELLGPPMYGEREDGPDGSTITVVRWEAIRKARAALSRAMPEKEQP